MPHYTFRNLHSGEMESFDMTYEEMIEFREKYHEDYKYVIATPGFITKAWDSNVRKAASKDGAFRENMEIMKKRHPTLKTD